MARHFLSRPILVNLNNEDDDGNRSSSSSSSASSDTSSSSSSGSSSSSSSSGKRGKSVPMTVLVLDEIDMGPNDGVAELVALSRGRRGSFDEALDGEEEEWHSSLVLLGIGNDILYSDRMPVDSEFNKKLVFSVYTSAALTAIITKKCPYVFDKMATIIVVAKIVNMKNGKCV